MRTKPDDFKDWKMWALLCAPWVSGAILLATFTIVPDFHYGATWTGQILGFTIMAVVMAGFGPAVISFGLLPIMGIGMVIDFAWFMCCRATGQEYVWWTP